MLQDFPDVPKSAKYDGKVKPDKIDWDKIIKDAVEAGKEVPEVDWAKPGADAGLAVSPSATSASHHLCLHPSCQGFCSQLSFELSLPTTAGIYQREIQGQTAEYTS